MFYKLIYKDTNTLLEGYPSNPIEVVALKRGLIFPYREKLEHYRGDEEGKRAPRKYELYITIKDDQHIEIVRTDLSWSFGYETREDIKNPETTTLNKREANSYFENLINAPYLGDSLRDSKNRLIKIVWKKDA